MHVLIVSHGYEPLDHVSATRGPHMARELTALGWDVSALTVDWSRPPSVRIPSAEVAVYGALREPPPRRIGIDGRLANPRFDPTDPTSTEPGPSGLAPLRKLATLGRTLRWGPYRSWARHASRAASLLHRERPIDVVWAIHGDDSCHAIAHFLRRRLGIPWIADYKDPWDAFHSRAAVPLQRLVTARRLRTAAALTETCEAQARADAEAFGLPAHVIYSGYDAALMAEAEPVRPGDGCCVSYLGSVGRAHDLGLLGPIFAELLRRGAPERSTLRVHQYGPVGQLRALLGPVGGASLVHEHGRVPRARAFSLMRGSDALLLFPMTAAPGKLIGLKEIEAFASGTPVLIPGEPLPELEPLIRACPQVCVARSAAAGADFLEAAARTRPAAERRPLRGEVNAAALREFTWPFQARRLSEVLSREGRGLAVGD